MKPRDATTPARLEYGVFFGLSMLVLVLAAAAYSSRSPSFQRFFGGINPLAVVLVVLALGAVALHLLVSRVGLAIFRKDNLKGILLSSGLSVPFAALIIFVDGAGVFSADINVPFPESLAFYPAMGLVAQILFQVSPLCVLTLALSKVARRLDHKRIVCVSAVAVSVIEPLYQARFMIGHSPLWAVLYVGVHVYMISFVQLTLFKRYDFISMYAFRISYYVLWHILWGHVRLSVLF